MKKKNIEYLSVRIEGLAAEGKAFAHIGEIICFVPFCAPGDIVDLLVTKKRSSYMEAVVKNYVELSPLRTPATCQHFGTCGGCKWQHIPYPEQLKHKQQTVVDHLQRIGHLSFPESLPIIGSEDIYHYRNKLEYTFCNKRWLNSQEIASSDAIRREALGFHIPGMFDRVLDIQCCHLQDDFHNDIRNFIRTYALEHTLSFYDIRQHEGLLRNMILRCSNLGHWMLLMVFAEDQQSDIQDLLEAVSLRFPQITALLYTINTKLNDTIFDLETHVYKGDAYICESMPSYKDRGEALRFIVGPKSFYQTNSKQAHILYQVASDLAQLKPEDTVYDLYTGAGTIAQFIARSVRNVIGIEYVESAITDAQRNAEYNRINNVQFFAGDMVEVLNDAFVAKHGRPSLIITDPPRAGMHEKVVQQILKIAPERIVYISCNSATQARDLAILSQDYDIKAVQAVDMFPHTHHIESVVSCRRKY